MAYENIKRCSDSLEIKIMKTFNNSELPFYTHQDGENLQCQQYQMLGGKVEKLAQPLWRSI
jgi:hypothetical protein